MARIRAVKPEFWSSPNHPDDPWARLLFVAMWNWADDAGVGTANLRELAGFAFPNDDQIDVGAMRRMCADISAHYGAQFYTVNNRPYYSIPSWREHQKFDRRREGKHPGPEQAEKWLYQDESDESAHCADSAPTVRRQSGAVSAPEIGTGELGTKNSSSTASPSPPRYTDDFESWWKLYPRRVGKGAAAKAYAKIDIDHSRLEDITRRYAESVADTEPRFIPHPATWLNERRFDDDTLAPAPTPEDTIREMWRTGSVGQLRELTGMVPDDIRWPEPEPPDFDADAHRLAQRRSWIETNRDEILRRLKAAM